MIMSELSGTIPLRDLSLCFTKPVYILAFLFCIIGLHTFAIISAKKVEKHSLSNNPEASQKCARLIRQTIVRLLPMQAGYCTLGIILTLHLLDGNYNSLQIYTIGMSSVLLGILPPGLSYFMSLENLSSPQQLPKGVVSIPLFVRFGIVCLAMVIGSVLMMGTVAAGIASNFIDPKSISFRIIVSEIIIIIIVIINIKHLYVMISKPIKSLTSLIGQGMEGDLTINSERETWDETGQLIVRFNDFSNTLRNLIVGISRTSETLSRSGSILKENVASTSSAVQQISSSTTQTTNNIASQMTNIEQTGASIEQITKTIESLNSIIYHQSTELETASSAVEEMVLGGSSVLNTVVQAGETLQSLTDASQAGLNGIEEVVTHIRDISGSSESLKEANSLILNVAEQTNLLAMNAAIEAAHAGDAGKGFAVVSDEIRKLAESSTEQSKNIALNVDKVLFEIKTVVELSDSTKKQFDVILDEVDKVSRITAEIKSAMTEQQEGSSGLLNSISSLNSVTEKVKTGSSEMETGNREILMAVSSLKEISSEIQQAMIEISSGTGSIENMLETVSQNERENRTQINQISEKLVNFTV